MAPQVTENKEFSHWLEEWVAKINSQEWNAHTPPREETARERDRPQTHAEEEPALKH